MKLIKLRAFLLLLFVMMGKCSFSQIERTFLILDTADAKYYTERFYEYYNNTIIRNKVFYYGDESKLHYEFIRVDINKYYCIEYKTDGTKVNEGVAIKESKPFDSVSVNIFDSVGNTTGNKNFNIYKYIKDEFWHEDIDGIGNYQYGKYRNGVRDSIWTIIKDWNIEREAYYTNGKLIKEENINLSETGDVKIKQLLERKWDLQTFSLSVPLKFTPGRPSANTIYYLQFNDDGTFIGRFPGGAENNSFIKGSWELVDDYKKIKLTIRGKPSLAKINYISKYGLTLSFEQ